MRTSIGAQFVAAGMVADFAIHSGDDANTYARVMLTTRDIVQEAFGKRNVEWNKIAMLVAWRATWAEVCNMALKRAGREARIDHRCFAARGIDLEVPPEKPKRPKCQDAKGQAYVDQQMVGYNTVLRRNGEAIRMDPTIAVKVLLQEHRTLEEQHVIRFLRAHTADEAQLHTCLIKAMAAITVIPK